MTNSMIMQHAGAAVDEVRGAEFFRKGGAAREVVKGKRWLLLSRWTESLTTAGSRYRWEWWKRSMETSRRCYDVAAATAI